MFELVWPWAFALLPLPLLTLLLKPASREESALRVPFFARAAAFAAGAGLSGGGSHWRRVLLLLTWLALVSAAGNPRWIGDPLALPAKGRDLMLAVDISSSMSAEDLLVGNRAFSRLAVVKRVVGDFVERRVGDRIGLILFGTNAYLQTPLTFDRKSVRTLLEETPLGIAGGKTAIGDAIGLGVKRLVDRPAASRVLILLTDGVNNVGEVSPLQAAELAAQEGVTIHTIGFGGSQSQRRGLLGMRSLSATAELDEETLTTIATSTGGVFRRARNVAELLDVYAELDALEPIEQASETFRPVRSLYAWPLGFALLSSFALALWHALQWAGLRILRVTPAIEPGEVTNAR